MLIARPKRVPSWKYLLLTVDVVLVAAALAGATLFYCHIAEIDASGFWSSNWRIFYLTGATFVLSFYLAGLYDARYISRLRSLAASSGWATTVASIVSILAFYLLMPHKLGRLILLPVAAGLWIALILVRRVLLGMLARGFLIRRALVIGSQKEAAVAIALVLDTPQPGLKIYGVVTESAGMEIGPIQGVPVVGHLGELQRLLGIDGIGTLIVAASADREWDVLKAVRPFRYQGLEVLDVISLHEELAQEIPLDYVTDEWLLSASMNNSGVHIARFKRVMDLGLALIGLLLTAPLIVLAALCVKLNSRGPVLLRQQRMGQGSSRFSLLKFRTMFKDAEADTGAVWAEANDPRITFTGRWLRRFRIDEIPQLLNVLRGQMSLVGPRPERPAFVEQLTEEIPYYGERLLVPPGITGWAQVNLPYAASVEETRRKLQYDLYYIKHMSFLLDCLVLLRTLKIVLLGLYRPPAGIK